MPAGRNHGQDDHSPVTGELDRMEKAQTLCGWLSDGRGSSVLCGNSPSQGSGTNSLERQELRH